MGTGDFKRLNFQFNAFYLFAVLSRSFLRAVIICLGKRYFETISTESLKVEVIRRNVFIDPGQTKHSIFSYLNLKNKMIATTLRYIFL